MLCTSHVSPTAILIPERCLVPYSRFAFVHGSTCHASLQRISGLYQSCRCRHEHDAIQVRTATIIAISGSASFVPSAAICVPETAETTDNVTVMIFGDIELST